jgi:hypothetical protein
MPANLAGCIVDGAADTFYGSTSSASATWALYDASDSFVKFQTGYVQKTLIS